MRRNNGWDTKGTFFVELYVHDDGIVYETATDKPNRSIQALLPLLQQVDGYGELVIEFRSKGYHDPGSRYGGPDNLGYPPEGDDERTLLQAYIYNSPHKIPVPPQLAQQLWDTYEEQIYEAEIDRSPDYGDYDDINDDITKIADIVTEDPDIFN